ASSRPRHAGCGAVSRLRHAPCAHDTAGWYRYHRPRRRASSSARPATVSAIVARSNPIMAILSEERHDLVAEQRWSEVIRAVFAEALPRALVRRKPRHLIEERQRLVQVAGLKCR